MSATDEANTDKPAEAQIVPMASDAAPETSTPSAPAGKPPRRRERPKKKQEKEKKGWPPELVTAREELKSLLDNRDQNLVRQNYKIGLLVAGVMASAAHGEQGVKKLARALKLNFKRLYEAGKVAETYDDPKQFEALIAPATGKPLDWSKVLCLVSIDNKHDGVRRKLEQEACKKGLTVKQLKRRIQEELGGAEPQDEVPLEPVDRILALKSSLESVGGGAKKALDTVKTALAAGSLSAAERVEWEQACANTCRVLTEALAAVDEIRKAGAQFESAEEAQAYTAQQQPGKAPESRNGTEAVAYVITDIPDIRKDGCGSDIADG